MKRRRFIATLVCGAGWTAWQSSNRSAGLDLIKTTRNNQALGSTVSLTVYTQTRAQAEAALSAAFQRLEAIENVLSLYRGESDVCRLNREGHLTAPSADLVQVLTYAQDLSARTEGAFDITVQPLWDIIRDAEGPCQQSVAQALQVVDWRQVKVSSGEVSFGLPGMAITLNGIAQGYATDAVAQVLNEHGVSAAFIDAGEVGTLGEHTQRDHWKVGIKHPREAGNLLGVAQLQGRSLATSGDYETHFCPDYTRHHLLDPHTGLSANALSSVTIAAPSAMQADALSTAVFVLGPQKGRALIESLPRTDALFVGKDGEVSQTRGFPVTTLHS